MRLLRIAALTLVATLTVMACKKDPPSRWEKPADSAGQVTTTTTASAKPVVVGGSLNKFFPPEAVDGKKRRFTVEKPGFVEAKVEADGKEVATLTITDTNGADDAAKFDKATDKLGDYPLLNPTKKQTSILVAKRFQVKVSSPTLAEAERKDWLQKFDLAGLSKYTPVEEK